jgi:WD40 repeat protein
MRDPQRPATLFARLSRALLTPAVALDFGIGGDELTAVYASMGNEPGQVVTWNIKTEEAIRQFDVEWVHPRLTSLSDSGHLLVTVEDRERIVDLDRPQFNFPQDINAFLHIWNLDEGKRQKLLPYYGLGSDEFTIKEIAISPNGRQILTISTILARLASADPAIQHGGQSIARVISSEDPDFVPDPLVVGAFDKSGRSFALAFERGNVWLQKLTDELYSEYAGALAPDFVRGERKPVALAFDFTGERLAILRTNSVELRNLHSWSALFWPNQIQYDLPTVEAGKIAFSPRGGLLAIATAHGWQLRHTSDLELVAEQIDLAISSLAFSEDGCTVAFGAPDGTILVWSLSEP